MSYDDFIVNVPEETKTFINNLLMYLRYYMGYGEVIGKVFKNSTCRQLAVIFLAFSEDDKYSSYIKNIGFKKENFKVNDINTLRDIFYCSNGYHYNASETFKQYSDLFLIYDNDCYYEGLTPLKILENYLNKNKDWLNFELFRDEFNDIKYIYRCNIENEYEKEYTKFVNSIGEDALKEEEKYKNEIEKEIYGDLPISVIDWLQIASSIHNETKEKMSLSTPLCLLCAINFSNNKELIKLKNQLNKYDYQKIIKATTNVIGDKKLEIYNSDVYIIKKEYMKYVRKGVCENKKDNEITISDVFKNLLDRNISEDVIVENLFSHVGYTKEEILEKINSDLNNIYNSLDNKAIEFIEFASKVYQLIKNNEYNKKYIITKNDIIVLSLYIANHYYEGKLNEFFEANNVNYDEVLKLLNLEITKEEIDKTEINSEIIINNYNKYLSLGEVSFEDICSRLYNANYCDSLILKNIFNKLSVNYNISDNFNDDINNYFEEKHKLKIQNIYNRYFLNTDIPTLNFIERISRIYQNLSKITDLQEEDLKAFSILLSALWKDGKIKKFLSKNNVEYDHILIFIANDQILDIINYNIDIEIIIDKFSDFVLNDEIKIENIVKKVFDKKIYNSILFNRFMYEYNIKYDNFIDFDKKYNNFISIDEALEKLASDDEETNEYFIQVLKIHNLIKEQINLKENNIIKNNNDLEIISLLLSYLIENESKDNINIKFLNKHGITKQNILDFCNLDLKFENKEKEIDYKLFLDNYSKYFDYMNNVIKKIVKEDNEIINNIVNNYGGNYNILKEEIETGKEHQLTLSERIELLSKEQVDNLDMTNISSILNFGNSLSIHSRYIHDELPKLLLSGSSEESIQNINSIINRAYIKETGKKKKSFLERFFLLESDEENIKYTLNPDAIKELRQAINDNINILAKELMGYDSIRKYIEVYHEKNKQHLLLTDETIKYLEEKLSKINTNNDSLYNEYLNTTSHLQVMREKEKRFNTSSILMKQELFKVNQTIVNHFITINALEMARDDLLPLIGAEIAINSGRATENNALELSKNVMDLFQSILTRNVDSARLNMEKLKEIGLNEETFNLINRDITTYLSDLGNANEFSDKIINNNEESKDVKRLVLNPPTKFEHNFFPDEIY